MKSILGRWNFMRLLRLALAIIILIQGAVAGETVTIILGILFAGMAVANVGCCGANGCAVKSTGSISNKTNDI